MGFLNTLSGFGGRDMAVDLGTANTLVYLRGRGIVLSEPSVVAIDQRSGEVHAVGVEAKRMLGRTPGTISAIRPLKDGVIADFDVTEQMLRHFIQKVHQHRFAHPRVVVCVPSGVTGVEKRAVEEATLSAGARAAYLIEEPMAAAIGAGLPVAEPTGNMIVDIGGGTTEVAVISLGGIVVSQSLRVGGDEMDEAIINHIKREYKLLVGQQTAEEIKLEVGSAWDMREEVQAEVRGRDMLTGLPKTVILFSEEVRRALDEPVVQIIDAIKSTLDKTPPELAADIMDRGIVLAGGGTIPRSMMSAASSGGHHGSRDRAAAGEHDPAIHDVRGELGRRLVERRLDRVDDLDDRLVERAPHLLREEDDGLRQAGQHVTAAHLGLHLLAHVPGRADLELDLLGGLLADEQLVLALDVIDDRLVHLVAADAQRLRDDDPAQRDDGDLGGAAADVDDHVPGRLRDGQPGPDRGRHRLLDQVGLARAGAERRLLDRALLDAGHA